MATGHCNNSVPQQGIPSLDRRSTADPGDCLYSEIPEISSIGLEEIHVYAEVPEKMEDYEYTAVQKKSVGIHVTSIL